MTEQMNMDRNPQPPDSGQIVDAEAQFRAVFEYFKWLVKVTLVSLGIIIGVGMFFFYRDINQYKVEAKRMIDETTTEELAKLKDEASKIALREAQQRVDAAFRTTNVQALVENAARRMVGSVVERQVRRETSRAFELVQSQINAMGKLADLGTKMRIGLREGMEGLIEISRNSPDHDIRERARKLFETIADDYERVELEQLQEMKIDPKQYYRINEPEATKRIPYEVEIIRSSRTLGLVAYSFQRLKFTTGFPFSMFDIEQVEEWCRDNKPRCEKSEKKR